MKALVTGGTGFIGSHLVEALLRKGIQVRCLVRKPGLLNWIQGLPVECVGGDCRDPDSLGEAVKGVQWIFHVAGVTKAPDEETFFEINARGTENLVLACLAHNPGIEKFIYVSSQAASGPCSIESLKREIDPCDPVSPYGRSKKRGEEFALSHANRIPLIILRPSAIYGPRDQDIYVFLRFLSKRIMPCLSAPDQHISLCYVQDLVRAILLSAEIRTDSGECFFISDGEDYLFREIGNTFATALGVHAFRFTVPRWCLQGVASFSESLARISGKPALISRGKVEEMIQKNWGCDITKARNLLGYEPGTPLPAGARLTVDWYRSKNWL